MNIRALLLAALAVIAVLLVLFGPLVLDRFTLNVLTRSMIYAMLAITVDLLWGFTGVLTFGQAAFFGIGAYATAMLLAHAGATPGLIALAFALAILAPMLVGLIVGWLSFSYKATPLYATVISLVLPIVTTQVVFSGGEWTGSSSGLVGYGTLPFGLVGFFRLAGFCLIAIAIAAWFFVRSDAGKLLVAIRDNEARCAYLGLNPQRIKIALTTVLAGVAGLAGFLFANSSGVVAPEITGFVFGTELVIWTALGGRGTIIGPVAGTIGIDYLSAHLSGELPFLWNLVIGALFVAMIILLPNGLAALVAKLLPAKPGVNTLKINKLAVVEPIGRQTTGEPLLAVKGLGKAYGSLKVLEDLDFDIRPGELVSLVGPNGAGKTSLMRCLSDGTEITNGTVRIAGRDTTGRTPNEIVALGVGRKFQVASIFESLTAADCLRLALAAHHRPSPLRRAQELDLPPAAIEILGLTGLDQQLDRPAAALSHGLKQSLELAMVVALEPRLILLDEPTAGLTKTERTTIGSVLQKLTSELGIAAIVVEHDLDFVRTISSRVVVLHQGRLVLDGSVADVANSELVKTIYSGGAHA
ncbi:MAG TPA: ATP-binding cassette domain-containing protein [Nordella sp.]|nr:ATP-binding cassette domain-containing protein [Nordella sp.]